MAEEEIEFIREKEILGYDWHDGEITVGYYGLGDTFAEVRAELANAVQEGLQSPDTFAELVDRVAAIHTAMDVSLALLNGLPKSIERLGSMTAALQDLTTRGDRLVQSLTDRAWKADDAVWSAAVDVAFEWEQVRDRVLEILDPSKVLIIAEDDPRQTKHEEFWGAPVTKEDIQHMIKMLREPDH